MFYFSTSISIQFFLSQMPPGARSREIMYEMMSWECTAKRNVEEDLSMSAP